MGTSAKAVDAANREKRKIRLGLESLRINNAPYAEFAAQHQR
jgi:hypothetical protein